MIFQHGCIDNGGSGDRYSISFIDAMAFFRIRNSIIYIYK